MHRTYELKASLEHCRAWKRQLESQLSEFAGGGDNRNQQEHQLKALQTDLENAQNNISSPQRQARRPDGLASVPFGTVTLLHDDSWSSPGWGYHDGLKPRRETFERAAQRAARDR